MDYMKRWAKTHPRVVVYFDLADYEHVRKRADELGLTISEFIKRAVKGGLVGEYERGFYEGYRAGLRDGHYSELVARFGEPALELIVDLRRDEKLRKVKLAILEGIIKFCSEARGGGGEHVINKICVIDSAIDGFRRAGIELEGGSAIEKETAIERSVKDYLDFLVRIGVLKAIISGKNVTYSLNAPDLIKEILAREGKTKPQAQY